MLGPWWRGHVAGWARRPRPPAWLGAWPSLASTSSGRRHFLLGIESSCDDSAAAVLSEDGTLLGESMHSQQSVRFGGVVPSFAMGFHAEQLPRAVGQALERADIRDPSAQLAAIAVTNRPGLSGSLSVGLDYACYLSRKHHLPLIPIHHMEAHALTVRLTQKVPFPFLVLLVSGGHSLLAMAEDISRFKLLGTTFDNSPGEVLDKTARCLRLQSLRPDLKDVSGGRAVEIVASEGGNPLAVPFTLPRQQHRDCHFSYSGLKAGMLNHVKKFESEYQIGPDEMLPNAADFCASLQYCIARHLCQRVQRGLTFCELEDLWGESNAPKTLVVSGGVASNKMIKESLQKVCSQLDCQVVFPPPKYCTDNGVMIAWNGLEKYRRWQESGSGSGGNKSGGSSGDIVRPEDVFDLDVSAREPFGEDWTERVARAHIKCKWIKILEEPEPEPEPKPS